MAQIFAAVGVSHDVEALLRSGNAIAFNGVAAVMAFFVISGMCIHFPTVHQGGVSVLRFWIRRFTRVGLPLFFAVALGAAISGSLDLLNPVLWSLYCELIYYAIYPALCVAALKFGWVRLWLVSTVLAVALAIVPDSHAGNFSTYGVGLTWILGLPVWLLGVIIVEKIDFDKECPSRIQLNFLRISLWIITTAARAMHFHTVVHYKVSMLLFSILAAYWIIAEIKYATANGTCSIMEKMGAASYSIYLCHLMAIRGVAWGRLFPTSIIATSIATIVLASVISATFFFVVERPSHDLARRLSQLTSKAPRIRTA